jgi:hypothetical protein
MPAGSASCQIETTVGFCKWKLPLAADRSERCRRPIQHLAASDLDDHEIRALVNTLRAVREPIAQARDHAYEAPSGFQGCHACTSPSRQAPSPSLRATVECSLSSTVRGLALQRCFNEFVEAHLRQPPLPAHEARVEHVRRTCRRTTSEARYLSLCTSEERPSEKYGPPSCD